MTCSDGTPDIQAALAVLKEGFGKKIPAKIEEIRQSWKTVSSTSEDPGAFVLQHRQAHTLAVTAAT